MLDPLWMVPQKWANVLFKPANLPLELLGGAAKADARGLAERIPWAKAAEFGKGALQSGARAAGMFSDELKPRLVELRERVAQAIEREIGLPEAIRREIAGKLRGFQIRTPGELLNTVLEGPKGQPKIWDYLPSQVMPDDALPLLREVGEQLKGLSHPTRETVTQIFDDARMRARQWVEQAKEAAARMAPREPGQAARDASAASAGKEPSLRDIVNRKREEVGRGLDAAKKEFQRRMEALYPPTNRELAPEGLARGRNSESNAGLTAASAGEGPAGKEVVGPKMPSRGEQPVGPKMPTKGEPAAGSAGEGGSNLPGGAGGEPPGKRPVDAAAAAKGDEESLRRMEALHPARNKGALRREFLKQYEEELKPFYPLVNAGENVEITLAAEAEELGKFGLIFASPNTGNLTLDEAVANLGSSRHRWFERGARAVAEVLIPDAEIRRALGVWLDGAENSVAIIVGESIDAATLDYVAARLGHVGEQKQVLRFKADADGMHALYVFDVASKDVKALYQDALAHGVPHMSFVSLNSGTRVLVFDEFLELSDNVFAFGGAHGATNQQIWSGTGRWLGDPEGKSREIAELEYRRVGEEFEREWLGGKPGRVFGYSPRTSAETRPGRGGRAGGVASPFSIPTSIELSDWPREVKSIYAAWLRSELGNRGIPIPDELRLLSSGAAIGDFQSLVVAAVARAAARARGARTPDDDASSESEKEGGFASFGLYTREGVEFGHPPRLLEESTPGPESLRSRRRSSYIYPQADSEGTGGGAAAAAIIAATAAARAGRTSDDVTSPQSESKRGSSGFGGAHGATNRQTWFGTGRPLRDPEGKSKEIAELEYARIIGENEKAGLAGKPWRVLGYSPRASDETPIGRQAGLAPLAAIPASTELSDQPPARAQAYGQWADRMLANLNAALDDWQAQALAKLARPVGPALPIIIPKETANRWAQMLSNELRQAVGESAWAVDRRLSSHATQRGIAANDVGAAIRSARAPHDSRQADNVPELLQSRVVDLSPNAHSVGAPSPARRGAVGSPSLLGKGLGVRSYAERARAQADQAKLRQMLGRRKQPPRPPLSLSQQMAQLYRGTIAGDGYTRARDNDAWAMVPDNLKGALEEYWRGTPLTRAQVQRLLPVYRRYVAKTGDPGDMVQWIAATLREQRYPQRRVGGRGKATTTSAAPIV